LTRAFSLRSRAAEINPALNRIEAWLREQGVEDPQASELRLVAEELLTNAVKYAFEGAALHELEVRARVGADAVEMSFLDDGRPFDPLAHPEPDLFAPPEERPVGGLGIVMVKGLCDRVAYRREAGWNVVTITKRRPGRLPPLE
jgi:anti-sigma regulatory factor (Ser/Thr protein kinase)